jgi:hypothetical protein
MASRNTTTGHVLEQMVLPALRQGGYATQTQVAVGTRLGGRRHVVDIIATKGGKSLLVSMKWQQTSGTAERIVPFEVMCLSAALAVDPPEYAGAYLVLGGDSWTLRDFYVSGGLDEPGPPVGSSALTSPCSRRPRGGRRR